MARASITAGRLAGRTPRVLGKNGPTCNSLLVETA